MSTPSSRNSIASLLREFVNLTLVTERGRKHSRGKGKRKKKPGGPRTDVGAMRQLQPDKFRTLVRAKVKSHDGDVGSAAHDLGVAKRTLYHYLDDEPGLSNVKTTAELPEKDKED
jgi:hypothetical protein